jgi:hypothetical protein
MSRLNGERFALRPLTGRSLFLERAELKEAEGRDLRGEEEADDSPWPIAAPEWA